MTFGQRFDLKEAWGAPAEPLGHAFLVSGSAGTKSWLPLVYVEKTMEQWPAGVLEATRTLLPHFEEEEVHGSLSREAALTWVDSAMSPWAPVLKHLFPDGDVMSEGYRTFGTRS